MKATWTALALTVPAWLAAAGSAPAAAMSYTVTDLGWLPGSSLSTPGQGGYSNIPGYAAPQISNAGTVSIGTGNLQAGAYAVSLGTVGGGFSYSGPGTTNATVLASGGSLPYHSPEDVIYATGVNTAGTAIGLEGQLNPEAFVYRPGGPTTPGQSPGVSLIPGVVPGTTAWYAYGINSAGEVVGQAPGSASDRQVYLRSLTGIFDLKAFLFNGTTSVDLNTLISPDSGWLLTTATSINDLGQIVGVGIHDNTYRDFLLTPTPEPSTLLVGLAGIGFLMARRAKGKRKRGGALNPLVAGSNPAGRTASSRRQTSRGS